MTDFFEFRAKLTKKEKPAPVPPSKEKADKALSVTELTKWIEFSIQSRLPETLLVRGEVSNFSLHRASGHAYFTLKDASSCIDCAMWRSDFERIKFKPTDGMELLASGHVGVYAQRGRYQLYVRSLSPIGQGALELAFQQMRQKLEAEGLFDPARKKTIPLYPRKIAIITGAQAAALHDVLKVLRRYAWLKLFLYAVPVQGDGAADKIAAAIRHLSKRHNDVGGVDVILLARGGGSLEDLWAFNEEAVARAIAGSSIPIVTGIGHEVDVSIADLVGDHHAHTPTEAAQTLVTPWRNANEQLRSTQSRLMRYLKDAVASNNERLTHIRRHAFFRRPLDPIRTLQQTLDDRQRQLNVALTRQLWEHRRQLTELTHGLIERRPSVQIRILQQRLIGMDNRLRAAVHADARQRITKLDAIDRALAALSPESVLKRGYSITTLKKGGAVVRSASQIKGGEQLVTRVEDGQIESTADDPNQPKLF